MAKEKEPEKDGPDARVADALGKVIEALESLSREDRRRVLRTAATWFKVPEPEED